MKFKFLFAWYDLWVGLFWDAKKRRLYVFPVPMFGFWVQFERYYEIIGRATGEVIGHCSDAGKDMAELDDPDCKFRRITRSEYDRANP